VIGFPLPELGRAVPMLLRPARPPIPQRGLHRREPGQQMDPPRRL